MAAPGLHRCSVEEEKTWLASVGCHEVGRCFLDSLKRGVYVDAKIRVIYVPSRSGCAGVTEVEAKSPESR